MKTFVLGLAKHPYVNNISLLPPSFTFKDGDETIHCIIHTSPVTEIVNGFTVSNFDLMLDFAVDHPNQNLKLALGKRYLPIPRYTKENQNIILSGINIEGFVVPRTYKTYGRDTNDGALCFISKHGIPHNTDKVIVKEVHGAKGANQALVPKHRLELFLAQASSEKATTLYDKFPDVVFTTDDKESNENYFTQSILVQEYIPNVAREFRLLVSGDDYYIRERGMVDSTSVEGNNYKHANINYKEYRETELVEWINLTTEPTEAIIKLGFTEDQIKIINYVLNHIDIGLGSVDLFLTDDGKLGVFEWCHQFAFNNSDPGFIRQLHIDFIKHLYHNYEV